MGACRDGDARGRGRAGRGLRGEEYALRGGRVGREAHWEVDARGAGARGEGDARGFSCCYIIYHDSITRLKLNVSSWEVDGFVEHRSSELYCKENQLCHQKLIKRVLGR